MSTESKLQFSIPANNQKVIEIYNKYRNLEIDTSPAYQRKLVWRKQHKFKFIETILLNYPFPEIYLAPGKLDVDKLTLKDEIVDGQQRITTIVKYIEGKDVFALAKIPILKFNELDVDAKEAFLNYEISVRYLKNTNAEQVREIFQRINSTEYSLNITERLNAEWGDSEFICFAKQIIEADLDIDTQLINYQVAPANRHLFLEFFHKQFNIFSENDVNRMLALQYILTLITTLTEGNYFRRNEKVQGYIERYFDEFDEAGIIEHKLVQTLKFIDSLRFPPTTYWFNKANFFTLVCEIYRFETTEIDPEIFSAHLSSFEGDIKQYMADIARKAPSALPLEKIKYFEFAREAVNEKVARDYRGDMIKELIIASKKAINPELNLFK